MRPALFALLAPLLLCTGCATVTTGGGPDQRIRISSEPRGAKIFVDGNYKGLTPTSVSMTRKDNHLVRLELDGHQPFEKELKPGGNVMTLGNVLVGGLVGLGVDAISGAMVSLSPGEVDAKMVASPGHTLPTPGNQITSAHATQRGPSVQTNQATPAQFRYGQQEKSPEYHPSGIIK